jgi:hypothetical protein
MTKEQRGKFMKDVVMPKMKPVFTAFDAKEFAKFECKTCHGDGVADRSFKMPSPSTGELPTTQEGFADLMKDKPEWVKFMGEQVKPQMAALLGIEEYNPQAPKPGTFGCYNCHVAEK